MLLVLGEQLKSPFSFNEHNEPKIGIKARYNTKMTKIIIYNYIFIKYKMTVL